MGERQFDFIKINVNAQRLDNNPPEIEVLKFEYTKGGKSGGDPKKLNGSVTDGFLVGDKIDIKWRVTDPDSADQGLCNIFNDPSPVKVAKLLLDSNQLGVQTQMMNAPGYLKIEVT